MKRKANRKINRPASDTSRPPKRQRKATQPFEQGYAVPYSTLPHNQGTPSPPGALFVAEDEDVEEELAAADAGSDDDSEVDTQVQNASAAATAVEEIVAAGSPGSVTAASLAQSSQARATELGQLDEEPHLHWNYRAWWTLGKNPLPQAAVARRNKPLYTVDEDKVWYREYRLYAFWKRNVTAQM
ncbi:hypothetical protein E8E12_000701 [Didymella heteroderae]|uniref:Uncharacterized protein n=1 Tax=Didymella heteroderae TaxID=1769908 RepID=A0A9P5BV28_9PLEO|nr:hypothetical protein E8E12_000701 [Didymella heteroderae]